MLNHELCSFGEYHWVIRRSNMIWECLRLLVFRTSIATLGRWRHEIPFQHGHSWRDSFLSPHVFCVVFPVYFGSRGCILGTPVAPFVYM